MAESGAAHRLGHPVMRALAPVRGGFFFVATAGGNYSPIPVGKPGPSRRMAATNKCLAQSNKPPSSPLSNASRAEGTQVTPSRPVFSSATQACSVPGYHLRMQPEICRRKPPVVLPLGGSSVIVPRPIEERASSGRAISVGSPSVKDLPPKSKQAACVSVSGSSEERAPQAHTRRGSTTRQRSRTAYLARRPCPRARSIPGIASRNGRAASISNINRSRKFVDLAKGHAADRQRDHRGAADCAMGLALELQDAVTDADNW